MKRTRSRTTIIRIVVVALIASTVAAAATLTTLALRTTLLDETALPFLITKALSSFTSKETSPPLRVMIDPGHTAVTVGGRGKAGDEYVVNYKVAMYLAAHLDNDPAITYEISRDETNYTPAIRAYLYAHEASLRGIAEKKLRYEKKNRNLSTRDRMDMYAVRHYTIQSGFDCLLSIHFNYDMQSAYERLLKRRSRRRRYRRKRPQQVELRNGFHIIISPFNETFASSLSLAFAMRRAFLSRYPMDTKVGHDETRYMPPAIPLRYSFETPLFDGISVRSIIMLGDAFEHHYYADKTNTLSPFTRDVPSVLIECGYLHNVRFRDEEVLRDLGYRIYLGVREMLMRKRKRKEYG